MDAEAIRVRFAVSTETAPVRGPSRQAVLQHPTCEDFTILRSPPISVHDLIDALNARPSIPRGSDLFYLEGQRWVPFLNLESLNSRNLIIKAVAPWIPFKRLYESNDEGRLFLSAKLENPKARTSCEATILFDSRFLGGLLLSEDVALKLRLQPKGFSEIFADSSGTNYVAACYGRLNTAVLLEKKHFCSEGFTDGPAPCALLNVLALGKPLLDVLLSRVQTPKQDLMVHQEQCKSSSVCVSGCPDLKVIPVKQSLLMDTMQAYDAVIGYAALKSLNLDMNYDAHCFIETKYVQPMSWNMWLLSLKLNVHADSK